MVSNLTMDMVRQRIRPERSHRASACRCRPAYSLVEMMMVIVIIGMLAAMAIPRMSRGSTQRAGAAALAADLTRLRGALDRYAAEHAFAYPGPEEADVVAQLTLYTNVAGATASTRGSGYVFGPYLVSIPALQVGPNKGARRILIDNQSPPQPDVSKTEFGWVYNPSTGEIVPNIDGGEDVGIIISGLTSGAMGGSGLDADGLPKAK